MHSLSSEAILLERIGAEFVIYQDAFAETEITDDFDMLNGFQIQQMQFPTMTRFVYIIHYITPSKTENERYLSLEGIYTASCHANTSVEMISEFLLININSAALVCNTTIGVFGGSLDDVADLVDEMKSNLYAFADASDTE